MPEDTRGRKVEGEGRFSLLTAAPPPEWEVIEEEEPPVLSRRESSDRSDLRTCEGMDHWI